MMSITSTRYLSNVDWLQDVVQGTDLILCGVSALEYLELFNGYVNESKIQVYAQNEGQFDNIEYHIVNSFDDIEYLNFDGVLCTTVIVIFQMTIRKKQIETRLIIKLRLTDFLVVSQYVYGDYCTSYNRKYY